MARRLCEELHLIEQPSLFYGLESGGELLDETNGLSSSRLLYSKVFGLVLLSFGPELIAFTISVLETAVSNGEEKLVDGKASSVLKLDNPIVEIFLSPNDDFLAVRTKKNIYIYETAALMYKDPTALFRCTFDDNQSYIWSWICRNTETLLVSYEATGGYKVISAKTGECNEYVSSQLICLLCPSYIHSSNSVLAATSSSIVLFNTIDFSKRWELNLSILTNKSYPVKVHFLQQIDQDLVLLGYFDENDPAASTSLVLLQVDFENGILLKVVDFDSPICTLDVENGVDWPGFNCQYDPVRKQVFLSNMMSSECWVLSLALDEAVGAFAEEPTDGLFTLSNADYEPCAVQGLAFCQGTKDVFYVDHDLPPQPLLIAMDKDGQIVFRSVYDERHQTHVPTTPAPRLTLSQPKRISKTVEVDVRKAVHQKSVADTMPLLRTIVTKEIRVTSVQEETHGNDTSPVPSFGKGAANASRPPAAFAKDNNKQPLQQILCSLANFVPPAVLGWKSNSVQGAEGISSMQAIFRFSREQFEITSPDIQAAVNEIVAQSKLFGNPVADICDTSFVMQGLLASLKESMSWLREKVITMQNTAMTNEDTTSLSAFMKLERDAKSALLNRHIKQLQEKIFAVQQQSDRLKSVGDNYRSGREVLIAVRTLYDSFVRLSDLLEQTAKDLDQVEDFQAVKYSKQDESRLAKKRPLLRRKLWQSFARQVKHHHDFSQPSVVLPNSGIVPTNITRRVSKKLSGRTVWHEFNVFEAQQTRKTEIIQQRQLELELKRQKEEIKELENAAAVARKKEMAQQSRAQQSQKVQFNTITKVQQTTHQIPLSTSSTAIHGRPALLNRSSMLARLHGSDSLVFDKSMFEGSTDEDDKAENIDEAENSTIKPVLSAINSLAKNEKVTDSMPPIPRLAPRPFVAESVNGDKTANVNPISMIPPIPSVAPKPFAAPKSVQAVAVGDNSSVAFNFGGSMFGSKESTAVTFSAAPTVGTFGFQGSTVATSSSTTTTGMSVGALQDLLAAVEEEDEKGPEVTAKPGNALVRSKSRVGNILNASEQTENVGTANRVGSNITSATSSNVPIADKMDNKPKAQHKNSMMPPIPVIAPKPFGSEKKEAIVAAQPPIPALAPKPFLNAVSNSIGVKSEAKMAENKISKSDDMPPIPSTVPRPFQQAIVSGKSGQTSSFSANAFGPCPSSVQTSIGTGASSAETKDFNINLFGSDKSVASSSKNSSFTAQAKSNFEGLNLNNASFGSSVPTNNTFATTTSATFGNAQVEFSNKAEGAGISHSPFTAKSSLFGSQQASTPTDTLNEKTGVSSSTSFGGSSLFGGNKPMFSAGFGSPATVAPPIQQSNIFDKPVNPLFKPQTGAFVNSATGAGQTGTSAAASLSSSSTFSTQPSFSQQTNVAVPPPLFAPSSSTPSFASSVSGSGFGQTSKLGATNTGGTVSQSTAFGGSAAFGQTNFLGSGAGGKISFGASTGFNPAAAPTFGQFNSRSTGGFGKK